jgi:uncharacterized SAM-binding protein YcdF (DUF218 family)
MKKIRGKLIFFTILALAQFFVFRGFWLTQLGSLLIYQDKITPADAIFVLGGGKKERVVQGIDLYKKQFGGWMLFTGEPLEPLYGPPTHWAFEAQKLAVSEGIPMDRTIPITNSYSTFDDATLSRGVCLNKHFKSLIVVSEPYHTRRSHYVFNKVFRNSGIKVMIYPVQKSWFKKDRWWKSKEGFWAVNIESQKFIYYLFKGLIIPSKAAAAEEKSKNEGEAGRGASRVI